MGMLIYNAFHFLLMQLFMLGTCSTDAQALSSGTQHCQLLGVKKLLLTKLASVDKL